MINDILHLRVPKTIVNDTLERIKTFAIFSDVLFEDVTEQVKMIALRDDTLEEFNQIELPHEVDGCFTDNGITITKIPGGVSRYEIYVLTDKLRTNYADLIADREKGDPKAWHRFSIEAGVPLLYPETIDKFTPHDLNLQELNAVSFNKGCYTGQEIVARMEYRGTLKKRMRLISIESKTPLTLNEEIFQEDSKMGTIIDFERAYAQTYKALAVIKDDTSTMKLPRIDEAVLTFMDSV